MNIHATKTRSEQRIEQLINIGRPLSELEAEELYRALHADYMRKWRAAKAHAAALRFKAQVASNEVEISKFALEHNQAYNQKLLKRLRREAAQ
jgi:hypothetical protein